MLHAYFSDPTLLEHLGQSTVFAESLTKRMLKNGASMREFAEAYAATRARMGLQPVHAADIMYARAVEIVIQSTHRVDLLTSRDAASAVRSTKAAVWQEERKQQLERRVKVLVAHTQQNLARLRGEAWRTWLGSNEKGRGGQSRR